MEELNKVFTEQQVEEVSEKILKSTIKKVKSELTNNFYNEMNDFIYQHYNNASDKIHERLIEEITDEFIAEPKDYKFLKLRQKLFNENKEVLTTILISELLIDFYKSLDFWSGENKQNLAEFKVNEYLKSNL